MYSEKQLIRLGVHRAILRQRIALRRSACAEAVARVARPIEWIDRAVAFMRRLSPVALIAALPLGGLIQRAAFPRLKALAFAVRWAPLVCSAVRSARGVMTKSRARP